MQRINGDYDYMDNTFVFGAPMQNTNPLDGSFNPTWDTTGTTIDNHTNILTGRGVGIWGNQDTHNAPIPGSSSGTHRQPRPYLGTKFDPLYHKKKKQARNHPYQHADNQPNNQHHVNHYHSQPKFHQPTFHQPNFHQPNNFHSDPNRGSGNNRRGCGRGGFIPGNGGGPAIGQGGFNRLAIEPTASPKISTPGSQNNQ
ncbi:uncharacterized protein MELLADRAFT_102703 [Melampsora larici-populina 98AG31]|uniref:Uncharacterized protein n=1 Tax=Melampsora larici-populina (strain 98AG31 / pathotype 3-4-7) TaxID=747676 RepID=F4R943_MELLP|nr:uncharacterized protein MELLADRAFT_102703 [Melampsora larici-populina 98AG31]EGG10920.1 hypothetical protein MELLADRAFT_102703 [Melampsora larici-populina 98AG31]